MNALRSQSLPDTDFKDPDQVLASLNVAFPGETNDDMFFTVWYGVYNKRTRELTYASGGHPPALLIGDTAIDDSRATPLRTPKNVISAIPDAAYQSWTIFTNMPKRSETGIALRMTLPSWKWPSIKLRSLNLLTAQKRSHKNK